MKLFTLFFCLLTASSLKADLAWQTITPIYQNEVSFRVELPGTPVEEDLKKFHAWKSEAEGNTYYVAIKSRNCSHDLDKIKICDYMPLVEYAVSSRWKIISFNASIPQQRHIVMKDKEHYCLISIYFNQDLIVALMTKTAEQNSMNHQHFIESFAFLK